MCHISRFEGRLETVAERRKKSGHGGARPGAGRPKEMKNAVGYRLQIEQEDLEALRALSRERKLPVSELIRRAIRTLLRRQRR